MKVIGLGSLEWKTIGPTATSFTSPLTTLPTSFPWSLRWCHTQSYLRSSSLFPNTLSLLPHVSYLPVEMLTLRMRVSFQSPKFVLSFPSFCSSPYFMCCSTPHYVFLFACLEFCNILQLSCSWNISPMSGHMREGHLQKRISVSKVEYQLEFRSYIL